MSKRQLSRVEAQVATRRELLRAASRLFLRDGYVSTSLTNIANEAGVTKGAVYSNFESKEELFLALLQEPVGDPEIYAPSKVDIGAGSGAGAGRAFGRYAASVRASRRHVALFLETNSVALRSDRVRRFVAGNTRAFAIELGTSLRVAFDAPHADPLTLGLLAQSLYAGLLMHGAFLAEIDDDMFAAAFEVLATGARTVLATDPAPTATSR